MQKKKEKFRDWKRPPFEKDVDDRRFSVFVRASAQDLWVEKARFAAVRDAQVHAWCSDLFLGEQVLLVDFDDWSCGLEAKAALAEAAVAVVV